MKIKALVLACFIVLINDNSYAKQLETIQVNASIQDEGKIFATSHTEQISGFALQQWRANTLGDTINKLPGVHSSHFGPNSGTPVIRSFQGQRVQVLNNNLNMSDVAGISGNLPLPIQANLVRTIEVHKAGASILYGGRAIGGAVNVYDGRIPREQATSPISGKAELTTSYNQGHTQFITLDGGKDRHAWHLDASNYYIPYYRIPGNSKFSACHDPDTIYTTGEFAGTDTTLANLCQVRASTDDKINPAFFRYLNDYYIQNPDEKPEFENELYTNRPYNWTTNNPNPNNPAYQPNAPFEIKVRNPIKDRVDMPAGRIPNSHLERRQVALGRSYFFDQGYAGLGFKHFNTEYGVPGFSSLMSKTGIQNAFEPINIRAQEDRISAEIGLYQPLSFVNTLRIQSAISFAQTGEYLDKTLSNSLDNRSEQIRLTADHTFHQTFTGTWGAEYKHRNISGDGADRYLPDVFSHETAVFAVERFQYQPLTLELGGRLEYQHYKTNLKGYERSHRTHAEGYGLPRHFMLYHAYLGSNYQILPSTQLRFSYTHAERAPEANELYASNTHFAIWAVELGDSTLHKEQSHHIELGLNYQYKGLQLSTNLYRLFFKNYTYMSLSSSGEGSQYNFSIPIRYWKQSDNLVYGIELEGAYRWKDKHGAKWETRLFGDYVINKPISPTALQRTYAGNYLPGLPTNRLGIGLNWIGQQWRIGSSLTHYFKQSHRGNYFRESTELPMPAYTLWDALISYQHRFSEQDLEVYLDMRNLLNTEARPYNSPIKYLSPLPGRSATLGIKLSW